MLWFERQVVGALMSPKLDPDARAVVEAYVSSTLHSMPEHLRGGVAAESIVLGARSWIEKRLGRLDEQRVHTQVARWKQSNIDPIRQYVRLLESLVLFAENELVSESL